MSPKNKKLCKVLWQIPVTGAPKIFCTGAPKLLRPPLCTTWSLMSAAMSSILLWIVLSKIVLLDNETAAIFFFTSFPSISSIILRYQGFIKFSPIVCVFFLLHYFQSNIVRSFNCILVCFMISPLWIQSHLFQSTSVMFKKASAFILVLLVNIV